MSESDEEEEDEVVQKHQIEQPTSKTTPGVRPCLTPRRISALLIRTQTTLERATDKAVEELRALNLGKEVEKAVSDANACRQKALLGYAKVDVVALRKGSLGVKLSDRGINPRPLDMHHVRNLQRTFAIDGKQPFLPQHCIRLGIRKEWLESMPQRKCVNLRDLQLSAEAKDQIAQLYNGNHRIASAQDLIERLTARRDALKAGLVKSTPGTTEHTEALETLAFLGDDIERECMWGVEVYDLGTCLLPTRCYD